MTKYLQQDCSGNLVRGLERKKEILATIPKKPLYIQEWSLKKFKWVETSEYRAWRKECDDKIQEAQLAYERIKMGFE